MNLLELHTEEELLTMLGWGEARGEPTHGILAVMWVAKNRSDRRQRALKDVILQPWQFSCFNERDPNRAKLITASVDDPKNWGIALGAARLLLSGWTRDPTGGATHFYSVRFPVPYWAKAEKGWKELTQIGNHVFGLAR